MPKRKAEKLLSRPVRKVPVIIRKWPDGEEMIWMLTPLEDLMADLPNFDEKPAKNDETAAR